MTNHLDPTAALAAVGVVLEESKGLGFLGPGPIADHIAHAQGFADVITQIVGDKTLNLKLMDLGSGGGVPGLVLAVLFPHAQLWLLDGATKRTSFLHHAVSQLEMTERVHVVERRAEEAAHLATLRTGFDVVVARSFGPPSAVAECCAGFLHPGGWLIVSEPPEGDLTQRWPAEGLEKLGFAPALSYRNSFGFAALELRSPAPANYPRKVGTPLKRPLF